MLTVDWSEIPVDILGQIVDDYLTSVEDYLRICRVCRSWYAICRIFDKSKLRNTWSRQIPLLMLTDGNDNDNDTHQHSNTRTGRSSGYYSFKEPTRYVGRFNAKEYVIGLCDVEDDNYVQSEDEEEKDRNEGDMVRCMMSLSEGNNNNNNKCFNVSLPEAYKKACWGSQYGWIVTLGRDRQMSLLNPLTKATLALPSQRNFAFSWKRSSGKTVCHRFIHKAVLIRVPRNQRCHGYITRDSPCCAYNDGNIWVVVVIHQRAALASIAKPGDYLWAPILRPSRKNCYHQLQLHDVTYCNRLNSLLFVDRDANLLSCSLEDIEHPQVLTQFMNGPLSLKHSITFGYEIRRYIVEYGDDVLVITRHIVGRDQIAVRSIIDGRKVEDFGKFDKYLTFKFRVHKVNFITQNFEELHDLGNCSLFLGNNSTILVPSNDIGCETNSIYFCDDRRWGFHFTRNGVGGHDMGVFRMIDKTIRPFYDGHRSNSSYCCPFWFCRSL